MIVTYISCCLPNNYSILHQKHSSSLSLNDLNRLEPRGCKLIRLTGQAIQVSDEADKNLKIFNIRNSNFQKRP